MSILNSILKTFVGDKTKKDLSKITPLISKINDYQKNRFLKKITDNLKKPYDDTQITFYGWSFKH